MSLNLSQGKKTTLILITLPSVPKFQIEGPVSPAELVEILQRTLDEQGVAFGSGRAKEEEKRRADRQLKEEQDAAYLAALRIDQVWISNFYLLLRTTHHVPPLLDQISLLERTDVDNDLLIHLSFVHVFLLCLSLSGEGKAYEFASRTNSSETGCTTFTCRVIIQRIQSVAKAQS